MNLALFKDKNFSLLMLGKLVSFLGTKIQSFALSLYVLAISGSVTKFAGMLAVTMIPNLVLGPIVGVIVDNMNRKKAIVILDIISGVLTGVCAFVYFMNGKLELPFIYAMVIIFAIISMIFNPTIQTVIPSIIPKEKLLEANATNTLIMQIGNLMGPVLAGLLYGSFGLGTVMVINAVSFLLSALSECFIAVPALNRKKSAGGLKGQFVKDFKEGIAFTRKQKKVLAIVNMGLILNFFFNPVMSIGLIYVVKNIYGMSDVAYGMLQSIIVGGMIVAPIVATRISKKHDVSLILSKTLMVTAGLLGLFAVLSSGSILLKFDSLILPYGLLIAVIALIACLITIGNISLSTVLQQSVPNEYMGRVGTIMNSICMLAVPLGQIIFGYLFDNIEAWQCILISALALGVAMLYFRPKLINHAAEEWVEVPTP